MPDRRILVTVNTDAKPREVMRALKRALDTADAFTYTARTVHPDLLPDLQWAIDEMRCAHDGETRDRAERLHELFQLLTGAA